MKHILIIAAMAISIAASAQSGKTRNRQDTTMNSGRKMHHDKTMKHTITPTSRGADSMYRHDSIPGKNVNGR